MIPTRIVPDQSTADVPDLPLRVVDVEARAPGPLQQDLARFRQA